MPRWAFILALLAGLSACTTGERIRGDAGGGFREGMTPDEVIAVAGRPDGVEREGDYLGYKWANVLISGWGWDRADYNAVFHKERLKSWGPGTIRQNRSPVSTIMVITPPSF